MTQQSSRGEHKRGRQSRMDFESTFVIPEAKSERIKDNIYTLFDDDFLPSTKAIKDWILESTEASFEIPCFISNVLILVESGYFLEV